MTTVPSEPPCVPRTPGARRRGFTLVELLVSIAVISILASLTVPSLIYARRAAWDALCRSNLNQIGMSSMLYMTEEDGCLPAGAWENEFNADSTATIWMDHISENAGVAKKNGVQQWSPVLSCPGYEYLPSGPQPERTIYRHYQANPFFYYSAPLSSYINGADGFYYNGRAPFRLDRVTRRPADNMLHFDGTTSRNYLGDSQDKNGGVHPSHVKYRHITDGYDWKKKGFQHGVAYGLGAGGTLLVNNIFLHDSDREKRIFIDTQAEAGRYFFRNSVAERLDAMINDNGQGKEACFRHRDKSSMNAVFADGHVASREPGTLRVIDITPRYGTRDKVLNPVYKEKARWGGNVGEFYGRLGNSAYYY